MANAGMGDFKQHLIALRLRRGQFDLLQGLAQLGHGPGAHLRLSLFLLGDMGQRCGAKVNPPPWPPFIGRGALCVQVIIPPYCRRATTGKLRDQWSDVRR